MQVLRISLLHKGTVIGGREVAKGVAELLPALMDRVGDSNARLRDAAAEAVMQLAATPDAGLGQMTSIIVK